MSTTAPLAPAATTAREAELRALAQRVTWTVRANAVAAVMLGLLLVSWPEPTLTVAATVLGLWLLLDGVNRLVAALSARDTDPAARAVRGVVGVLVTIAGILTVRHPGESVPVVVGLAGAGLLLTGTVEVVMAVTAPDRRGLRAALGAAAALAGLAIVAWPQASLDVLALVGGAALTVVGVGQFWLSRGAGAKLRDLR